MSTIEVNLSLVLVHSMKTTKINSEIRVINRLHWNTVEDPKRVFNWNGKDVEDSRFGLKRLIKTFFSLFSK